jgi:hypothetical protein
MKVSEDAFLILLVGKGVIAHNIATEAAVWTF